MALHLFNQLPELHKQKQQNLQVQLNAAYIDIKK